MSVFASPYFPTDGLCFYVDAVNIKSYAGTGTAFREIISKYTASASVGGGSFGMVNGHLRWTPGAGANRLITLQYPSSSITVPTGQQGSWAWFQYFEDQGDIDHPVMGKETGSTWKGENGFVFGTGWGTDGPRWGIGGTEYQVYQVTAYVANVWQCWIVTYNGGSGNNANGLKTYLNSALVDSRTAVAATIGSNANNLIIGATNTRTGNWGGYLDGVMMWNRELSVAEVIRVYDAFRGRYGL
jgi:hypothetical protein